MPQFLFTVDDGNSETDPISYIPGDIEVDPDGVEVVLEEPEIGAALPPGPTRKQEGSWSRVFNWPISPIHMALLPDNTILTYGTNPDAQNATAFTFDRWSRWKGKAAKSHATSHYAGTTSCQRQVGLQPTNAIDARHLLPGVVAMAYLCRFTRSTGLTNG